MREKLLKFRISFSSLSQEELCKLCKLTKWT
jgi:hypothetical protein